MLINWSSNIFKFPIGFLQHYNICNYALILGFMSAFTIKLLSQLDFRLPMTFLLLNLDALSE